MNNRVLLKGFCLLIMIVCAKCHTWMTNPTPASGGGTTASNASTQGPCGKVPPAQITAITATYTQTATGVQVPVSFMKANPHGLPYTSTINMCTSAPSACTTQAAFSTNLSPTTSFTDPNNAASSSSTFSTTVTVTIPSTVTGNVLIQYNGVLGGGNWFDCAYVKILPASTGGGGGGGTSSPCSPNPCGNNAACGISADGTKAVCTCNAGYYGTGIVCSPITQAMLIPVQVTLSNVSVASSVAGSVQNQFTANLATLLNFPASRIAYDQAVQQANGDAIVYFSFTPDPITGSKATSTLTSLTSLIATGSSTVSNTLGFKVAQIYANGQFTDFGSQPQTSDSSSSQTWIAGAVVGPVAGIALIALGVWFYRKRQNEGYSGSSKYASSSAGQNYASSSNFNASASSSYTPAKSSAPAVPARPTPEGAQASTTTGTGTYYTWTTHKDNTGHIYYFNHETGESSWELPKGSVAPLGYN